MNIGIDYDDTISVYPHCWQEVINTFVKYGFKVYIVTYRDSSQFQDMRIMDNVVDRIFTSGIAKKEYCKNMGINIGVWIDDCPESILYSYKELLEKI